VSATALSPELGALLEVKQLEVVYNRIATAVQGVTLEVPPGSIVAILGNNGAGKTTTLRAISGFLPSEDAAITDGTITYRGKTINGRLPHALSRERLVLVPERHKVFDTLTVRENLTFTHCSRRRQILKQIEEYFPQLATRVGQLAGYLSGGEKQMLAIGMALLCEPMLLLIDELSLGLAPIVTQSIMASLQQINRELGVTLMVVEQNAMAALSIASYCYVMESGRVVFKGTASELLAHQDIQEFYLGGSTSQTRSYRNIRQYSRKRRWWG
jgi:branched-chain amino acid transport system ATP-binding protein